MTNEFLKDISDYLYGMLSGKQRATTHRTRHTAIRREGQSNEILDYEDEAKARDAEEVKQHRNAPVVHTGLRNNVLRNRNATRTRTGANNFRRAALRNRMLQLPSVQKLLQTGAVHKLFQHETICDLPVSAAGDDRE
ncbi:unnamed protein product [Strongylus vulgaris]|uniref:Uncharacterized protein n=1 Tax=Strongylus vulgaris TaxID=40348 RepID=A0A3P7JMD1_STRVU|nr:unnamed protein product [Strongylus vulgaris]